jgi:hypothetical protein
MHFINPEECAIPLFPHDSGRHLADLRRDLSLFVDGHVNVGAQAKIVPVSFAERTSNRPNRDTRLTDTR